MVHAGQQSQVDAARLFRVHPAMVSRLKRPTTCLSSPLLPPFEPLCLILQGFLLGSTRAEWRKGKLRWCLTTVAPSPGATTGELPDG
jgi:hypothetical protein